MDYDKIFIKLNSRAEGFAVGGEEDDINELSGLGELIQRSESDDKVAVYQKGNVLTIVGDVAGPWAVSVMVDN